jgi:hypothetical protein
MLAFVREVRALLDRTARGGVRRWLCVRIPCRLDRHEPIGVDIEAFQAAGVDMFNICSSFFSEQQSDMREMARRLPSSSVYLESTSAASLGAYLGGYDQSFRRMTVEQLHTAGHLAFSRGGAGTSTFNFVYYRQHHDNPKIGPFAEPPFHAFKGLADPAWLATRPQHYFVPSFHGAYLVPQPLQPGASFSRELDLAPPTGGWRRDGRLRLQNLSDLGDSRWELSWNGVALAPTPDVSEPYPSPYPNCLGEPRDWRAWTVPHALLRDGTNTLTATMVTGAPAQPMYIDLALP